MTSLLALVLCSCAAPVPTPSGDLLIRNGRVVDGTGRPAFPADVLVRDGRIVLIASGISASAAGTVIDASGLVVAPGFIEPHAHISDIASHPDAENFIRQGITTIVASLHSMDQPYPLGRFLDTLRVAPNTVWTAGHTWMRKRVMGLDNRAPTAAELDSMRALVRQARDDGAIGLGTGLEYTPANFSTPAEVIALARESAAPAALYVTHLRDEGTGLLPAIGEALQVGAAAALPVHVSHLKVTGAANWDRSVQALAMLDSAAGAGTATSFDVYPYLAYSTYSDVLFPPWALEGGAAAFDVRARDATVMARLEREMPAIFAAQTANTLESVQFREHPSNPALNGRSLADDLRARGESVELANGMRRLIELQRRGGFIGVFTAMAERDVERFLLHPRASVSSDGDLVVPGTGFPHPRSYGAFPRVLGHYVRERRLLSLESAVQKMTQVPAASLHLTGRGTLQPGAAADITIFDPSTIADVATFRDPHHYAVGVRHVIVNGQPVLRDGERTGRRPGQPIRRAR